MAAIDERDVTFAAAGHEQLLLQGVLTMPGNDRVDRAAGAREPLVQTAVVLCPPHPAVATMDDALLVRIAEVLAENSNATLRFNYRGVGESAGEVSDGRLEPLDIAGAIEWLLNTSGPPGVQLCLVGHAFGAVMALVYAMHDPRVRAVVAVSPPVYRLAAEVPRIACPALFITGEYDEVAPRFKLEPWLATTRGPRSLSIISGARHLMAGYEDAAAHAAADFLGNYTALCTA